jgi:hypothetical protein
VTRLGTLLLAVMLVVCAGAYGSGISIAADAEATVDPSGEEAGLDDALALAEAEAMWAMEPATRDALMAQLGAELELDVAERSGLAEALGGREAAAAALAQAWAPLVSTVTEALGAEQPPIAIASLVAVAVATETPSIGEGMFGGYMLVALGAEGIVSASNDLQDGRPERGPVDGHPEMTVDVSPERAQIAIDATHEHDGLKTVLKTALTVAPCPSPDGAFEASATIDVSATKGSQGQNGTLDVKIIGHVNDDARLASSDMEYRMQWAKFGDASGQYVDVSGTRKDATLRRTGGAATPKLAYDAAVFGAVIANLVRHFVEEAAQHGWESGRCVRLDAVPSAGPRDLQPGQAVSLTAAPRSKIDGAAVGGSVTAGLTAGGATVTPSATKVAADASFTYVASEQAGKSGTVTLEARSKRGVAKATLELTTAAGRSYEISGSVPSEPKGIRLSGHACSLDAPFAVKTKGDILGGVTFRPSSEAAGKWSYKGKVFNAPFKVVGSGSYSADLSDDRASGTVDLEFELTIKIPVVGDQTRTRSLSLTLTGAPPCAG